MDGRETDRAQSVQIGAVLLFGFLIVSISVMQATIVPDQNRQVEFDAYQDAAADLADVRNDILAAAGQDTARGTTVHTGVSYPNRMLFVNPGPPPNRLATTAERNVSIENIEAVNSEPANTQTFVTTNVSGHPYTTRDLQFEPNYNVLNAQPMVVTGQEAYRVTDRGSLPLASQTLIGGENGERIHLTTIDGNVSTGGQDAAITTESVSTATRSVGVRSPDGSNITIRMVTPTGVTADEWVARTGTALTDRYSRVLAADNVTAAGDDTERVALTLNGSAGLTYQLRLSRVELRSTDTSSTVPDPDPAYIVATDGTSQTFSTDQARAETRVRVNDAFTNPVEGASVRLEASGTTLLDETGTDRGSSFVTTTDADGTVPIRVDTDGVTDPVSVTATAIDATSTADQTTIDLYPAGSGGGGQPQDVSSSPAASVYVQPPSTYDSDTEQVPIALETSEEVTIEALGFNYYYLFTTGNNIGREVNSATVSNSGSSQTFSVPGSFDSLDQPITIPQDGTEIEIQFNFEDDGTPENGDFFVVTAQFSDGVTRTFFIRVDA